jgi:hypothetical protein
MAVFETEYEKKSLTITTVLFILLFLFMLFFVIYPLPGDELVEEGGGGGGEIAINFGNSATGSGENYKSTNLDVGAKATLVKETPAVKEILTQNTKAAPSVASVKAPTKITTPKVTEPIKPKPSKSTSDELSNLLNGNKKGDGDDKTGGNKGSSNGSTSSNSYNGGSGNGTGSDGGNGSGQGIGSGSGYGSGNGSGTGSGNGNYQLGNRKALSKPQPNYTCNEQGVVVVQITVDQNGIVVDVKSGIRGTTNSARCLLDQAEIAAKKTKWESDNAAPVKQVGKIIYNFKLTE